MKTPRGISVLLLLAVCAPLQWTHAQYPGAHAGACPTSRYPFNIKFACTPEITKAECTNDSTCADDEKCCQGLMCITKCVKAVTVKPGRCPPPGLMCPSPLPPAQCQSDGECPEAEKCCEPRCSLECTKALPEIPPPDENV